MVLESLMLFSVLYCISGKLTRCRNLRGPFTLFFDFDGSEVIDFNPVAVVFFIG